MQEFKDKWEPVEDIDCMKRKPNEWANIYNFKLFGNIPNELWSEFEWAYNVPKLKYMLLPDRNKQGKIIDSYEHAEKMEMRALNIKRDIFISADMGEKCVLNDKYIETEYSRQKLFLNI